MTQEIFRSKKIKVWVLDHFFIVGGLIKVPDILFVEAMIDDNVVRVGRIIVKRLTLYVIKLKLLVIIFKWNGSCCSNYVLVLSLEFVKSIEVFSLIKLYIVHISQVTGVLLETLVPSIEDVIKIGLISVTIHKMLRTPVEVWNDELHTMLHGLVPAILVVSWSKPTIHSILVRSPHI